MHEDDDIELEVDEPAVYVADSPIGWTHWAQLARLVGADMLTALAKGAWTAAELVHLHQEWQQGRAAFHEEAAVELETLLEELTEVEEGNDG